jgi:hypothetical protein
MPIGTIYGFLIGAFIVGLLLAAKNHKIDTLQPMEVQLLKQQLWMLGTSMEIISVCALIGTIIEQLLT